MLLNLQPKNWFWCSECRHSSMKAFLSAARIDETVIVRFRGIQSCQVVGGSDPVHGAAEEGTAAEMETGSRLTLQFPASPDPPV